MSIRNFANIIAVHKITTAIVVVLLLLAVTMFNYLNAFGRITFSLNYVFNRINSPLLETFDISKNGLVLEKTLKIKKECSYPFDILYVSGALSADSLGQTIGSTVKNVELNHTSKLMRLIIEKKVGQKFIVEADKYFDATGLSSFTVTNPEHGGFNSGEFRRHLGELRLSKGDKRIKLFSYEASPKFLEVLATLEIPSQVADCHKINGNNILSNGNAVSLANDIKLRNATRSVQQPLLQDVGAANSSSFVKLGMTMDEAIIAGGYALIAVYEPSLETPIFLPIESLKSSIFLHAYPKFDLLFFNQNQYNYGMPVLFRAQFVNDHAISIDYVSQ